MSETRTADVPAYEIEGQTFRCFAIDGAYVWRSETGGIEAGRNTGKATCWVRCGGQLVGDQFPNLRAAMAAGARRRAAAA